MGPQDAAIKFVNVEAKQFESVAYVPSTRKLYIKFAGGAVRCYDAVPGFRYQGLLAAPRKDAYYTTYVKDRFLTKEVSPPTQM